MASTNKTSNYDLSQYIGSDKPTYLGDYNTDMQKIDAQMKTNADNVATAISSASTATSTANSANTTAQSALSTAETANTTAGQANTTATNAQTTANSALSTATTAQTTANNTATELNAFENEFNFTHFDNITMSSSNGTITNQSIKCASNEEGSIAKIYGQVIVNPSTANAVLTGSTRLRPESAITINCLGMFYATTSDANYSRCLSIDLTIGTDGTITIDRSFAWGDIKTFILFPCVLFLKDFGDTPTPTPNN